MNRIRATAVAGAASSVLLAALLALPGDLTASALEEILTATDGRHVATVTAGSARLVPPDGRETTAGPGTDLTAGQSLVANGLVTLAYGTERVRVAPGATVTVHEDQVGLQSGAALVESAGGLRAAVAPGPSGGQSGTEVQGSATYRLRAGVAAAVDVFAGSPTVRRPGEVVEVPALRSLALVGRRLAAPTPLSYDADDPFDAALLAPALRFDAQAQAVRSELSRRLGADPRSRAFYADYTSLAVTVAPKVRRRPVGPPADVLLAAALAEAADPPAQVAAKRVQRLRLQGARFGLIAQELGVDLPAFVAAVDAAEDRALAARSARETGRAPVALRLRRPAEPLDGGVAASPADVALADGPGPPAAAQPQPAPVPASGSDAGVPDAGAERAPQPPPRQPSPRQPSPRQPSPPQPPPRQPSPPAPATPQPADPPPPPPPSPNVVDRLVQDVLGPLVDPLPGAER